MAVVDRPCSYESAVEWLTEQHRGLGQQDECKVCKVPMPCPVRVVIEDGVVLRTGYHELQRRLLPYSTLGASNAAIQAAQVIVRACLRGREKS